MNYSEFKKLMGTDPRNRDSETLRARESGPEFEAAAVEAEAFEEKLQGALSVQAPDGLLNDITTITQQPQKRRNWLPLAMAASLLIAVGVVSISWKMSHQWDSVEDYVADHYSYDGFKVLAKAEDGIAEKDILKIMTRLGVAADQQFSSRILYIKYCPTPDGRGAHMIVSTDQGPMTIIYMPETQVTDGEMIEFNQQHALLVDLEHGSAAIIGEQNQSVKPLEEMLRKSLKTGLVGA